MTMSVSLATTGAAKRSTWNDLLFGLGGLTTSVGVVALNWVIANQIGLDVFSLFHWFVIPTGPLLAGAASGAGLYFVAKATHTRPSIAMLLQLLLVGAWTWFLYRFATYRTLDVEGAAVSAMIPFTDFMDVLMTKSTYSFGRNGQGSSYEAGTWGYWREGLSVLGVFAGSLAVFGALREAATCRVCGRYVAVTPLQKDTLSGEAVARLVEEGEWDFGDLATALKTTVEANPRIRSVVGLTAAAHSCGECLHIEVEWSMSAVVDEKGTVTSIPIHRVRANNELVQALRRDIADVLTRPPLTEPAGPQAS
jgi:hypothetical protein